MTRENTESQNTFSESKENHEFANAINAGITIALNTIQENYENPSTPDSFLHYHRRFHTEKQVLPRTTMLLTQIHKQNPHLVSKRDTQLGAYIAATHDIYQEWEENPSMDEDGNIIKIVRKRAVGKNEEESSKIANDYLIEINNKHQKELFTSQDMLTVTEAHRLTVPFWNTDKKTVVQQGFRQANIISQVHALADLGTSFMGDRFQVIYDSTALFIEDNIDFARSLHHPSGSIPTKKNFRERILQWYSDSQPAFINGRKEQTLEDIEAMPSEASQIITNLVPNFQKNYDAIIGFANTLNNMNYEELINSMQQIVNSPPEN